MSSTTETGHGMMVATFEDLINFCTGYGAAYNPSKVGIKTASLTIQLTNAQAALQAVRAAKTTLDNATNQREITFAPLKKFSTRIINSLAANDATQQTLDDARTSINKIQGKRAKKKPEVVEANDETTSTRSYSVSQQSYNMLISHFEQLISTVSAQPTYTPNEPELSVVGLRAAAENLRSKNTAVIVAFTALSNARIARDKALYEQTTGLNDTAQAVKVYIKSLFGSDSAEYKQVSGLKFKDRQV